MRLGGEYVAFKIFCTDTIHYNRLLNNNEKTILPTCFVSLKSKKRKKLQIVQIGRRASISTTYTHHNCSIVRN